VAYIGGLIVAALFFLALHYFTELNKTQKTIVSVTVFAIIMSAVAFNAYSSQQREQMLSTVLKFKQGKTITCNQKEVNSTNYTLSIGTYTFIGKKDTPNYAEMISASSCK
jgi:flagellar biosynthesis/type III secretory pathway M-ring protein FliF/YscJ